MTSSMNRISKKEIAEIRGANSEYETTIISVAGQGKNKSLVVVAKPFSASAQCFFRVYDHGKVVMRGGNEVFYPHEFDLAVEMFNKI